MTSARWIRKLNSAFTQKDAGLLAALEDFSYPDWEGFLHALAWETSDVSAIEQAFVPEPGTDLVPVVAASLEQLGAAAIRKCGLAIEAIVERQRRESDERATGALLVLLKLTIMIGRGPGAATLQAILTNPAHDPAVREAAASALSDYDLPYDAAVWEQLDYRVDAFAIPPCLSFYAVRDPALAIRFLSEFADSCASPERLYAATGAALWRLLKTEGIPDTRVALAGISASARLIIQNVLERSEFDQFGPDLRRRLFGDDQLPRVPGGRGLKIGHGGALGRYQPMGRVPSQPSSTALNSLARISTRPPILDHCRRAGLLELSLIHPYGQRFCRK